MSKDRKKIRTNAIADTLGEMETSLDQAIEEEASFSKGVDAAGKRMREGLMLIQRAAAQLRKDIQGIRNKRREEKKKEKEKTEKKGKKKK